MKYSWWQKIINYADKISTRPNEVSWRWKGHISPLTCVTLYAIYIARTLSLLQHCKFWFRTWKSRQKEMVSIDKPSTRVNVPPIFDEIYFGCWCVLLFVLPQGWLITRIAACYFMAESLVWLLYYFFFRRFYEEKYAIMHVLEYIILLPVLIMTQVQCVAIVYDDMSSFSVALANLFYPSPEHIHVYLILMSIIYTALIFGIFLSNLPIERVKEKGDYHYHIAIIGNGQIVKEKVVPAIAHTMDPKNIAIFDKALPDTDSYSTTMGNAHFHYFPIDDFTEKKILSSNILWIASPSFAHFEYLTHYVNQVFIVLEKPVTSNKFELEAIKKLRGTSVWNKVFCLSYYYQEKALPLTFLYNPYSFYEKYLRFFTSRDETVNVFGRMGDLRSVSLFLHEGEDHREWLSSDKYGGQYIETFLHLVVLARMVTSTDKQWLTDSLTIENYNGHSDCSVFYRGKTAQTGADITLSLKKFAPVSEQKRGGKIVYENGYITIDFNTYELEMHYLPTDSCYKMALKEEYALPDRKYTVQLDMAERCFNENTPPCMIDGIDLQIESLEWLFAQKRI